MNIVTGQHGTEKVNVQNAVSIGVQQMSDFSQKLQHDLYDTIHKNAITMIESKKHVKVGDTKVCDLNVIYSRVVGLQARGRDVDIKDAFSYELAAFPTSMFESTYEMRAATSKSSLKRQLPSIFTYFYYRNSRFRH
jgi:hypothetical protein